DYLDIVEHEVDSLATVSVVEVRKDHVLVDMGDKAEGIIPIEEFLDSSGQVRVTKGEKIDVLVEGRDEESGLIQISYKRARFQNAWRRLQEAFEKKTPISGRVTRVVKSGILVDVGIDCFMPASQISDERVENLEEWVNKDVEALVIDLNERRRRAVLSRRRIIEEHKRREIQAALDKIHEDEILEGSVKSILNFGAFLEVAGLDAFLPREEISWDRGMLPAALLTVGETVKVKIMQIDRETGRVRVSRKALRVDPWETVAEKYPEGSMIVGEIASVTRFGAFVRIEEGLTGLIHVSDLTWSKSPQKVTDHAKEGDTVRAMIVSIDTARKRLSLGLKQMVEDPWLEAERKFPRATRVKGTVTNLAPFGAFVKLTDDIEGMIHISDLDWENKIKHPGEILQAGQEVEAVVLKTDRTTRRISLGVKQLTTSPSDRFMEEHPAGSIVEGEVVRMIPTGVFVSLAPKLDGFLHVSQIDLERVEKPESFFKVGDKVRCKITKIEKGSNKISLSRKALIEAEQRVAFKQFKANPTERGGINLGDLLNKLDIDTSKDEKPQE
ncbi:S1 RNA-binding domain-containing protein, partial [bacterium]|nr:S1 RNA-binding domain-containing protein [bacterium]